MTRSDRSHLRLVYDRCAPENSKVSSHQFALPFPRSNCLYLADITGLDAERFEALLQHLRPSRVVDLRVLARLDVLAGSRTHAVQMFSQFGVVYSDLFARFSIRSNAGAQKNAPTWWSEVVQLIRQSPSGSSYLLLFDNSEILSTCASMAGTVLKVGRRRTLAVAQVATSPSSLIAL